MEVVAMATAVLFEAASYALLFLATYWLLIWAYRLLLHPLSRYPGPFLAKLSDFHVGYHVLNQRLHLQTFRDHEKYGPILRHGPNKLVFSNTAALHDIYLNSSVSKSAVYDLTRQANGVSNVFNAIDKNLHRRKSRLVGRAINERSMRIFEPNMTAQIDVLLSTLLQSAGQPLNMTTLVKRLSIDIVGLLGFGYELKTQTDERDRWLAEGVVKGNFRINSYMNFPALRHTRMDYIMGLIAGKARLKYGELVGRLIRSRLSVARDAHHDLYASMTDEESLDGEKPLPQSEIFQEAVFFIPAGADTVSAAICAVLFYITRASHRSVYDELAREIRHTFATPNDVSGGPKLMACKYLRACIDEALRMSPPIGGTLLREQEESSKTNGEQLVVDGHIIPHGVQIGVSIYSLHHNKAYFPDPFAYNPDRWLSSSEEQKKVMKEAFVPFSIGSRSCPGKAMAYLEMSLVIAKLVSCFDISAAPGNLGLVGLRKMQAGDKGEEYDLHDVFVSTHDGPYLVFQPRKQP
ncbi:cytochrome P450 [Stachybotrys elegans]|uniref:Cytochrome P450 n=1 Tax=Stachybotrys elegans TaxID=80388 RepID=A0A8K0SZ24_9HYPO|nr:cytochrome P450 [Stachybotrys elegans]